MSMSMAMSMESVDQKMLLSCEHQESSAGSSDKEFHNFKNHIIQQTDYFQKSRFLYIFLLSRNKRHNSYLQHASIIDVFAFHCFGHFLESDSGV